MSQNQNYGIELIDPSSQTMTTTVLPNNVGYSTYSHDIDNDNNPQSTTSTSIMEINDISPPSICHFIDNNECFLSFKNLTTITQS